MVSRKNLLFPFWIDMAVPFFFIISGYMYSLSVDKRELKNIRDWFRSRNFTDKFLRILIPFIIIFIVELFLYKVFRRELTSRDMIYGFFTGGWGPGSYYFPVLVQLLLLFPIILWIVRQKKGWLILILIQILFEIITLKFGMPDWIYRLLFFRYLGFVTFGVLLYQYSIGKCDVIISGILKKKYSLFVVLLLGVAIILLLNYSSYEPQLFKRWTTTSLPTILYCLPVVFVFTQMEGLLGKVPKILDSIITTIAKSTYHIFLVQMTYYWFKLVDSTRLREQAVVGLVVCIPLGIIFYYIENFLTERLFKKT